MLREIREREERVCERGEARERVSVREERVRVSVRKRIGRRE
jgi:hypothetical protein